MTMTWLDATEKVLSEESKPLNYKEVANKILSKKLVDTESKTPHITLHTVISLDIKAREDRGLPLRFEIDKGEVSLAKWDQAAPKIQLQDQAKRIRESTKSDLLKKLREFSGKQFESFLETLLIKMGYDDVKLRGGSSDEGIDLLCEMSQGINQVKTAVQAKCKQGNKKVGPKDVRLLRDILPKFQCSQGVLITTASFTKEAKDAANEQGRLPIILIDADRLTELCIEHEVAVRSQMIKICVIDNDFELFRKN